MTSRHNGWKVSYSVGWAVALAPAGAIAALFLGADDTTWLLGVVAGAVVGLGVARVTQTRIRLHRVLRVLGPMTAAIGVVGALLMFYRYGVERRTPQFLGGLAEFVSALLGLAVALTGGGLWLAGVSGVRRCTDLRRSIAG
jgi:hypothetical protein